MTIITCGIEGEYAPKIGDRVVLTCEGGYLDLRKGARGTVVAYPLYLHSSTWSVDFEGYGIRRLLPWRLELDGGPW